MRRAVVLSWLLAAGFLQAEAPMDLNSPFVQTVLIQEKNGEITEKAVRKGKINGPVLELEKEEGGLLVLPCVQVVALLPRLPQAGTAYLQSDAERALKILEVAQNKFPQRPEVAASTMEEWQRLGSAKTEHDQVRSAALDEWLKRSSRIESETPPEELDNMNKEGADFLTQFPQRSSEIQRELRGLKELRGIDLTKMDSVQFELGPLGENFAFGLILWALLIIPVVVALKTFPDALKGFREGVPLAGGLRFLIGFVALTFVALILLAGKEGGAKELSQEQPASAAARKAGWFSINHQEKWSNQSAKKIPLPASDWLAFLKEKTLVGSGADSFPFWHLEKPKISTTKTSLVVSQPLRAKFISMHLRFEFSPLKDGQSTTDMELQSASVGRVPLGAFFGGLIWSQFQASYQPMAEKLGLTQGVRWLAGGEGTVVVEIPGTRKPAPQAKDSLSAKELAEVFDQGFGEIYEGRVVTLEGSLVEVSSIQETLGAGTKLEKEDPMDEFTLEGLSEGPGRKYPLRVRCQFKGSDAYFLDSRGDLYKSAPQAQNPSADIPILRRLSGITKVRISGGRVESKASETRLITLYDCRKVEGFDGKDWVAIWGN